jgi:SpoVK/Ycf46/Vps4 family AAA+-type ATPase
MKKDEALVQLSRLALVGRRQDIQLYIRRMSRSKDMVDIKDDLNSLMHDLPSRASPTKSRSFDAIPVDMDSRLQLLRFDPSPNTEYHPIWSTEVQEGLTKIIEERTHLRELQEVGLLPTKTVMFVGKPGMGKTLAAKWLASQLGVPLLILDLSAVMSSFLGRTGSNLRMVLDYAKSTNCVLLLDEIDAIAKRRDDVSEIGELKRLVTVLLQEIDDWPSDNLMIAATNHPDLLDPALWRRFENLIKFPAPNQVKIKQAVKEFLQISSKEKLPVELTSALALVFAEQSYSDIEQACIQLRRDSILKKTPLVEVIKEYITQFAKNVTRENRQEFASHLQELGYSQRKISSLLRMGRDTVRKVAKSGETDESR